MSVEILVVRTFKNTGHGRPSRRVYWTGTKWSPDVLLAKTFTSDNEAKREAFRLRILRSNHAHPVSAVLLTIEPRS